MGYLPSSLGRKAAHFVSDLTTVLLNPISDESSKPPEDDPDTRGGDKECSEGGSTVPDGPDTSSFTAFLVSLLSSDSSTESIERKTDSEGRMSTSGVKENSGKKSFLARGKQKFGRAMHKAAKISGFRQSSEPKVDSNPTGDTESIGSDTKTITVVKDDISNFDLPEMSEPSLLLSENTKAALYFSLPVLVQGRNWVLLYSTWRHGISLSTLYRRSTLCPGFSLLVVGDKRGACFGGLVEAPLQPTNTKKYQGTNSSFVFTDLSSNPVIFRPTGSNRYFTVCSSDYLALGGGGHFALYLDGDLLNGSSSSSETFGNSCLAHSEEFEVKEVELWGFAYASQYNEMLELCRTEKPGIWRW